MEAFAALEKMANIWSNKVRHKSISSIAGATKETQEAFVARRAAFLRRAQKTEEEMALRKEKQRRAAATVLKAVQAKENEHIVSRPLKRFNCKMVVAIVVHAYNPKTKVETDKRMMVVMDDQLKHEKLASWVHNVTGIHDKKKLSFEYLSHQGTPHKICDRPSYQGWLDSMWATHPPTLHVFDHEYLLEQSLDRTQEIRDIFDEYDADKSGNISQAEMTAMVVEMNLARLGVSQDDIANFVAAEFERVDLDGSGQIDFDEFTQYFNTLKDYLKDKLSNESKYSHALVKFREELAEGKSVETQLRDLGANRAPAAQEALLEKVALPDMQPHFRFSDVAREGAGACGVLLLDAHEHDYSIEVIIPDKSVPMELGSKWVRAQTVVPQKIDYFVDGTGELGQLCSPTVSVEFEEQCDHALKGPYTVVFPHCFGFDVQEKWRGVVETCGDVVVCFSTWRSAEWLEVDHKHWKFVESPLANATYDCKLGAIAVDMVEAGLVCAFLRHDSRNPSPMEQPKTRVRAVAYLPEKMSPLEMQVLRVYLVPNLPDEIEQLHVVEQKDRGTVVVAGQSHVFECEYGNEVAISCGGLLVEADREQLTWLGEMTYIDFSFDPDDLADVLRKELREKIAGAEGSAGETVSLEDVEPVELKGDLSIGVSLMPPAKVAFLRRARGLKQPCPEVHLFKAHAHIESYPPPGPPLNLSLVARTNTIVSLKWDPPLTWGGCALNNYQIEYREVNHNDEYSTDWVVGATVGARKNSGAFNANIYKAEIRVRSFNAGSRKPSAWSEALLLETEKEEQKRMSLAKNKHNKSMKEMTNEEAVAESKRKQSDTGESVDTRLHVVVQLDLDTLLNVRHTLADKQDTTKMMEDAAWSDFRQTLGLFFVEAGVHGGARGTLFDLTPQMVEDLTLNTHGSEGQVELDEEKPLLSLALCGCWVLQTLAHNCEKPQEWIPYCNDITSLVRLAVRAPEEPSSAPLIKNLLWAMVDVYETLRQCDPGGYVALQLAYKYDKTLKKVLKGDWVEQKERLKNVLSTHVMTLVLYDRYKKHGLKKVMADTNVKKSMTVSKRMSQGGGVGVGDTDNMLIQ